MPDLFVSRHAVMRYRERVEDLPDAVIHERLSSAAIALAASFGAPYVRLSGGQRIVIVESSVVTVLPAGHRTGRLDRRYRDDDAQDDGSDDA